MFSIYTALLTVAVTLHVSTPYPTLQNPKDYGLNTCSGVFISPDTVLTAAHCVSKSRGHQWAKDSNGVSYEMSIVKTDIYKDLALLKVKGSVYHNYVDIGSPTEIGDKVFTVNSGNDFEETYSVGITNNIIAEPDYGACSILHSAPISSGASGSGLFNSRRQLIGINTAKIGNFSMATDVREINAFLATIK